MLEFASFVLKQGLPDEVFYLSPESSQKLFRKETTCGRREEWRVVRQGWGCGSGVGNTCLSGVRFLLRVETCGGNEQWTAECTYL